MAALRDLIVLNHLAKRFDLCQANQA